MKMYVNRRGLCIAKRELWYIKIGVHWAVDRCMLIALTQVIKYHIRR